MSKVTKTIQECKGAAIHRLLHLAAKAEKRGEYARAAELRTRAEFLKSQAPTIWG